ncbi:MAG: efflux RND transporter periplasmic adaptor subunit [Bryobacteraceae bacterium]
MSRCKSLLFLFPLFLSAAPRDDAATVELVSVAAKPTSRFIELNGEFQPFLSTAVHARVAGYVERVLVDRGSRVKKGDLLAELSAPEMQARITEASSKVQGAEADRLQAEAQVAAVRSTYERLKKAAQTPGAIAENELVQVQRQLEAGEALVRSRVELSRSAAAGVHALQEMQSYLRITAPFDGVVTDRFVHPGALVGPGSDTQLLVLQQISKLRLVVAVPEETSGIISKGAIVTFRVPAFPDQTFTGTVARSSHTLDPKSRTMAVELDVRNDRGLLAPGMYPTVKWPVHKSGLALTVPRTSVVTTTERTFVIRQRDGRAEWVDVKREAVEGDLLEVTGNLHDGDKIVRRATDEIRQGSPLKAPAK